MYLSMFAYIVYVCLYVFVYVSMCVMGVSRQSQALA